MKFSFFKTGCRSCKQRPSVTPEAFDTKKLEDMTTRLDINTDCQWIKIPLPPHIFGYNIILQVNAVLDVILYRPAKPKANKLFFSEDKFVKL